MSCLLFSRLNDSVVLQAELVIGVFYLLCLLIAQLLTNNLVALCQIVY